MNRAFIILSSVALLHCGDSGLERAKAQAEVSGAICDASNKTYVAGATVVLTEYNSHGVPLTEKTTTTDDAGHFSVGPIDAGTAKIHASKGSFAYDTEVTVKTANIALPDPGCQLPTGTIAGQVCNPSAGAWLQGATVSVATPNGTITAAPLTDVLGRFTLVGVPAGPRTVVAAAGGLQLSFNVIVPPEGNVDLGVSDCTQPGLSNIDGQICANVAGNWLSGATVTVAGSAISTITDPNGNFDLRGLPPGAYQVTATKGAFTVSFAATTTADKTTVLPAPQCSSPDLPVAVVSGAYDSVQKALVSLHFSNVSIYQGATDASDVTDLPITYSLPWADKLLGGAAPQIYNYKIVFFDSGLLLEQDDDGTLELDALGSDRRKQMLTVLQQYVQQGGYVYASDHAYEVLLGLSPDITFHGDMTIKNTANQGIIQDISAAKIVDPGLAAALGRTTLDVNFMLPDFTVVNSATNGAKIYVQSDVLITPLTAPVTVPQAPLLVSFPVGSGRAIFTSFFSSVQGPWADIATVNAVTSYLVFEL